MIPFLALLLIGSPYHTVAVDGSVEEYTADEWVLTDPPDDSYWGSNNELYGLYLTWDRDYLYVAVDYVVQNNAVLLLIGNGIEGVRNINNLDWYPRNFQFTGPRMSHILALWNGDLNTGGARKILDSQHTQPIGNAELANSGYSGQRGIFEAGIPWSEIYPDGVPAGATLHLVGLIAGGDHASGGESMPDNALLGFGGTGLINTYLKVVVDQNQDGVPDSGRSLTEVTKVVTYEHRPLKFHQLRLNQKVFRPGDEVRLTLEITESADVLVEIFNDQGQRVYAQRYPDVPGQEVQTLTWTQPDWNTGIYILQVLLNGVVRDRRTFAVVR